MEKLPPTTSRQFRSSSEVISSSLKIVHDHVLPPGWTCRYDQQSRKYYFIYETETDSSEESEHKDLSKSENDDDTFTTISTPERKAKIKIRPSSQEPNIDRICKQFPHVEKTYINYLLKLHNNRENLVISALLSESHYRETKLLDEALFYKLKQSFPHIEPDVIRKLLVQTGNKEHLTIEALLNFFCLFNTTRYEHSKKPQLKLKYLKFAFPDIDEVVLLDLLFKNEFDAGLVIKHLKSTGHEYSDDIKIRMSKIPESALLKEASERLQAPRPKSILFQPKYHPNLWEQEDIRKEITELYPNVNCFLVNWALEATRFDKNLTRMFLDTMTPQDSEEYLRRSLPDKIIIVGSKVFISKHVQTNSVNQDLFGRILAIEMQSDEEQEKFNLEMMDKSTWTKEDGLIKRKIIKLASGPDKDNKKGAKFYEKSSKSHLSYGPMIIPKGPDIYLKQGPVFILQKLFTASKTIKQGPQANNKQGAMGKQIVRLKECDDDKQDDDQQDYFMIDKSLSNKICYYY